MFKDYIKQHQDSTMASSHSLSSSASPPRRDIILNLLIDASIRCGEVKKAVDFVYQIVNG
jgi:hypothetical protein